ncbi:putative short-subunit dehydrogenase-like oxidoreductase (DUF2520 family) [Actimicrobium sp. GrIS 1.19]|uniref:Rossmann-like and DUF2520 domain-containing protein n=1 Tax=Actimicrobium sp. GrIS 1.19 TaxID=3071708 RepID=UPI002E0D04EF|nr:putative short-subunit dehydrogenase-like oxidoreductase (DUF2520 family) [Actimicrobium sp. GrIS 1.19]
MTTSLCIIGAGRVGKTLAHLWRRSGLLQIADVLTRSDGTARQAVAFIGAGNPVHEFDAIGAASLFLLAVPDDQIAACCARLSGSGQIDQNSIVFHCSGALGSDQLRAAAALGAAVASLHPVRSFADPERVCATFSGTFFGVEGDTAALATLLPLLEAIGARPLPIALASKSLYHAAAVFASNYLVTTLAVAQQAYVAAGIPPDIAMQLIAPLARESVDNAVRLGPAAALTGPIARGDMETVARQQQAIAHWDAAYGRLYDQLAAATVRLAGARE